MKILYIIYQVCFALPILLVLTILTALVTIIGSLIGGAHIWGYYPGKIWSQLICYILLIPVAVYPLSGAWKNLERAVYSDGHHFQLQFICQLESTSLEVPHVSREGTCPFGKYYQ